PGSSDTAASDFATAVIDYDNSKSGMWNNPNAVLGRPTVDTTGDFYMWEDIVAVLPVFGPWMPDEIYRIGQGTSLTVMFDRPVLNDPLNPCGVDFIIFGNTIQSVGDGQYWDNSDPNNMTIQTTNLSAERGLVSVSQDGITWYTFNNGPYADDWAPTLGRIYDPEHPDPSLINNYWWGLPTVATYPLNPALGPSDFLGKTVAEMAKEYGYSAGGTGFDLANLNPPLPWIKYVRVMYWAAEGMTPEIDAFSIVAPVRIPDFNCDSHVDMEDLVIFNRCRTGPGITPPGKFCNPQVEDCSPCLRADLDGDGDVDQDDFALFQRCYSGPDRLFDWNCLD
ncbi:MAG: hypothetical protein GXY44_08605, partial [Phycisphaerales bacterium]|nr:hypothetical protein [Phycisphaerales bacterium]